MNYKRKNWYSLMHLERQIQDWQNRDVIDGAIADTLRADIAENGPVGRFSGFSFLRIVIVFAAISFAAAILAFISANWDVIPRLVRVGAVMAFIIGFLVAGAAIHGRSARFGVALEEALYLLAGASYVAGVSLTGQMYHLPGTIGEAMFGFAIGLGIAGLAVRSLCLTVAALGAIAWWFIELPNPETIWRWEYAVLVGFCAAAFVLGIFWRSGWLRRLAVLALLVGSAPFLLEVYADLSDGPRVAVAIAIVALAALCLWLRRPDGAFGYESRPGLPMATDCVLIALVGILLMHMNLETISEVLIAGPVTLAFALFVLFVHGASDRSLRYFGYALFGVETFYVYVETVVSLLGTAGFFLIVGATLTALAYGIRLFERRFKGDAEAQDG